ncbi:hypothetical protein ACFXPW_10250 [Streptomyces goshikiensis]
MTEWIDPGYRDVVRELDARQHKPDQPDQPPVRGFLVPEPDEG